jgi:hypothetical protein
MLSMTAGVVIGIAYGQEIGPEADASIAMVESISSALSAAIQPGGYLVNVFPMRQ